MNTLPDHDEKTEDSRCSTVSGGTFVEAPLWTCQQELSALLVHVTNENRYGILGSGNMPEIFGLEGGGALWAVVLNPRISQR